MGRTDCEGLVLTKIPVSTIFDVIGRTFPWGSAGETTQVAVYVGYPVISMSPLRYPSQYLMQNPMKYLRKSRQRVSNTHSVAVRVSNTQSAPRVTGYPTRTGTRVPEQAVAGPGATIRLLV